jgi:hypothetical protein
MSAGVMGNARGYRAPGLINNAESVADLLSTDKDAKSQNDNFIGQHTA